MEVGRCKRTFVLEHASGVHAAGATHKYLGIVLGIKVEQDATMYHVIAEVVRSREACLLVYREESLHRSVYQLLVREGGKCAGYTDAVVCAQSGTIGMQPFAIDDGCDGIIFEVERLVIALAYHIHMRLQYDAGSLFVTGRGRFAHQNVAYGICLDCYAVLAGKVQ